MLAMVHHVANLTSTDLATQPDPNVTASEHTSTTPALTGVEPAEDAHGRTPPPPPEAVDIGAHEETPPTSSALFYASLVESADRHGRHPHSAARHRDLVSPSLPRHPPLTQYERLSRYAAYDRGIPPSARASFEPGDGPWQRLSALKREVHSVEAALALRDRSEQAWMLDEDYVLSRSQRARCALG